MKLGKDFNTIKIIPLSPTLWDKKETHRHLPRISGEWDPPGRGSNGRGRAAGRGWCDLPDPGAEFRKYTSSGEANWNCNIVVFKYIQTLKGSFKQKDHFTSGNGLKHPAWCQSTIFVYCDSFPIFFVIDIDIDMTDTRTDRRWMEWHVGHIDTVPDGLVWPGLPGAGVDGAVIPGDQVGGAGHPHHAGAQLSLWQMDKLYVLFCELYLKGIFSSNIV